MNKEEFGNYLTGIIQNGCVMAAIGIGVDLGLVKVICEAEKPMSVTEIADSLNLKERYTKEWLSTMVAAGIIIQDRDTGMYTLPPDHKPALQTGTGFAPVLFQFGFRSEKLKKCFHMIADEYKFMCNYFPSGLPPCYHLLFCFEFWGKCK